MTHCNDIYERLKQIEENINGCDINIYYTKDSRCNHMFCVNGIYESLNNTNSGLFSELSNFRENNPDCNITISNSRDGFHIKLIFDEKMLEGRNPEPSSKIDRITHYGVKQNKKECANCLKDVSNNPYPPISLYYKTPLGEHPEIKNYQLCIDCSPGHYDDVVRTVDRFLVEDGSITKVGFKKRADNFGEDDYIEWKYTDDISPYTEDAIEIIENRIISADHIE